MPRGRRKTKKDITVETYSHKGKKRKNNPPVGLVTTATDRLDGLTKYKHDPHIDPYLSWTGKDEDIHVDVHNVSLHIHERIDSKRIVKSFLNRKEPKERQLELFEQPENILPLNKAIDFYHHDQDWTNRLIAGDSLLVMNSLLKKEGMAGKVQMVYIDPPYGIKYNSNFQPFVNDTSIKQADKDEDLVAEPEMIQAFRDTWELGVHSYLTYLRDRALLSKELLSISGSIFVQISEENVHSVRAILDEVFGRENFVSQINIKRASVMFAKKLLNNAVYYVIWYAKDKKRIKYNQLFTDKDEQWFANTAGSHLWIHFNNGDTRKVLPEERSNIKDILQANQGSRLFATLGLNAQGNDKQDAYEYKGTKYYPPQGTQWKTSYDGLAILDNKERLIVEGNKLRYRLYYEDYPVEAINSLWEGIGAAGDKIYVVQTSDEIVKRCLLMTTDPGNLVFDPTCGSGTTAYVAEQWGRRWITCDTSRVAITLAKQRLMTAKYDYFELAHPTEGIASGFKYKTVPHVTLGSIANNEPSKEETLYDQPFVEKNKVRVTGPFTVEAVPSLRVRPFNGKEQKIDAKNEQLARIGETGKQTEWRDELKVTGIRATGGRVIQFSRIEPMVATKCLHAEGEILEENGVNKRAYISFGPDYGPLEQRQVEEALREARALKNKPDFVIFAAFHFDPEAAKDIDQINWPGVKILKTQMSVDLLTKDLRKKRSSSHSYWLIGQPDVEIIKIKDSKYKVKVRGFDYYNPVTGEIESKGTKQIAMWFLDTDYDERSLYPDQVFFPEGDPKRDWSRLAKALNSEVNEDLLGTFSGVESLPFISGENKEIAVKIIDNRGIESFVIKKLE